MVSLIFRHVNKKIQKKFSGDLAPPPAPAQVDFIKKARVFKHFPEFSPCAAYFHKYTTNTSAIKVFLNPAISATNLHFPAGPASVIMQE